MTIAVAMFMIMSMFYGHGSAMIFDEYNSDEDKDWDRIRTMTMTATYDYKCCCDYHSYYRVWVLQLVSSAQLQCSSPSSSEQGGPEDLVSAAFACGPISSLSSLPL